ncbi:PREDICTED: carboxypeptidase Q-like [Amphimedon queenslandica]|nr:PREDICTED: carboxypeptidase Q-like [Amphimedon queenslandica]|eukprot:XP_019861754.1 PREDICTED: carboxypeptidase Q-like [Amphimedon queenslandica]
MEALSILSGILLLLLSGAQSHEPVLSEKLIRDISNYSEIALKIIDYSLTGPGANQSYNRLATFVDRYGPRLSGSSNLEDSIDHMLYLLQQDGLDNVHGEEVNVTHWVRGKEIAQLLEPRSAELSILGLGSSVGTPEEGITADAVVMRSFDELEERKDEVKDRIVVFNPTYVSYPVTVAYRVNGASRASKYGAVATLIRTVGPFSIYSPHTGMQVYNSSVPAIPTACITIEDANMLDRLERAGERLTIHLYMEAQTLPMVISRNTVAEIKGSVYPDQVVVVSGHLDSWDVGQGAMDDGGGAFISWQALSIVKGLGLTPKRTLRLVMWTDEEAGGIGSQQYYQRHREDADKYSILFESDEGVFLPYGILFSGSAEAKAILQQIGQLLVSINASEVYDNGGGTDVDWWREEKVPTASLANHNEHYFWYHHSNGDTMDVLDPEEMNLCSAVWAVYAYVLADLDDVLPRG